MDVKKGDVAASSYCTVLGAKFVDVGEDLSPPHRILGCDVSDAGASMVIGRRIGVAPVRQPGIAYSPPLSP